MKTGLIHGVGVGIIRPYLTEALADRLKKYALLAIDRKDGTDLR